MGFKSERQKQVEQDENDWFFDHFDRGVKTFGKWAVLATVLNLVFWLAIITAVVIGLSVLL